MVRVDQRQPAHRGTVPDHRRRDGSAGDQARYDPSGEGDNTVRAVFIVDDKGIVRLMVYYPQEVGRNVDEIIRSLEALQVSDHEQRGHAGELAEQRTDR